MLEEDADEAGAAAAAAVAAEDGCPRLSGLNKADRVGVCVSVPVRAENDESRTPKKNAKKKPHEGTNNENEPWHKNPKARKKQSRRKQGMH
jgi:hypothetical protein